MVSIHHAPWSLFRDLRYLHLIDSSLQKKLGEDGYDPLFKIHTLIDHLSAVFPCYQPSQNLLVDEMMVGTWCWISFLQYLLNKTYQIWYQDIYKLEGKDRLWANISSLYWQNFVWWEQFQGRRSLRCNGSARSLLREETLGFCWQFLFQPCTFLWSQEMQHLCPWYG